MSQTIVDPTTPARSLAQRLSALRRRGLTVGGAAALLWGLAAALACLVLAVWIDLLWEIKAAARVSAWGVVALAGAGVGLAVVVWAARRMQPRRLASKLDEASRSGGQVLTGWDLASETGRAASPLRQGMAQMAVQGAEAVSEKTPAAAVVPWRPLTRAGATFGGLVLLVGGAILLMPKLAHTQWMRFTQPMDDHPPYSALEFAIEPGDARVVYGSGLDIYATVGNGPADRVELVLRDPAGGKEESLPMFQETDGRWRAALAQVLAPHSYFVRAGRARSAAHLIEVITVPKIESVRFRVTPPSYTQRGPYEGPLPQGGLSGLRGTVVEVWIDSNRPLSGGTVRLVAGDEANQVELQPSAASTVHGRFTIEQPGRFELQIVDADGQESLESFQGGVSVLDDQRPFVRLLAPRARSFATPNVVLPVRLAAEDDYGVARLELFRSLNQSRDLPLPLPVEGTPPRVDEQATLPLSTYGLSPGDVIRLFARVEDNDPAGGKGSESPFATVTIISEADFRRMQRMRQGLQEMMSKYRQAQRRMAGLDENARKLQQGLQKKNKEPLDEQARKAAKELSEQMRRDAEALRAAQAQKLPYDLDQELNKQLDRMVKRLERRRKALEDLLAKKDASPADLENLLGGMLGDLEDERRAYDEQVMLPLEFLEKVFDVVKDQATFVALVRRQRALAQKTAALAGRDGEDDPALKRRLRDFEQEQAAIRTALIELLDAIDSHADQLPEDEALEELRESAKQFVRDVRQSGALEAMAEAELALAEFEGTAAHKKATEAADILEQFVKQSSQMAGQGAGMCGLKFQPGGISPGNTIGQLLAEAGLLPGMGQGSGSGGGFSMQGESLKNVGLYGANPNTEHARRGDGDEAADGAITGGAAGRSGGDPLPFDHRRGATQGVGGGQVGVPARYQRRVDEYFRRLAEELAGAGE